MGLGAELPRVTLRPVSTVEALVGALRDQILDGSLPAGTALREADVASRFGVSRHTVRTALHALGHEGIVRHAQNRGAYVPELTADDVADVFRLRTVLEIHAVIALSNRDGDLEHVRDALATLKATGATPSWGAVRDADLAFHQALVDALGSARTSRTYASLLAELRLCSLELRPEFEDHPVIVRQHDAIFAAITAADVPKATRLIEDHLTQAERDIVDAMPDARTPVV